MTESQFKSVVTAVQWLSGLVAGIAAFLLVQGDIVLEPVVKVALGALIVAAGYINPAGVAARLTKTTPTTP